MAEKREKHNRRLSSSMSRRVIVPNDLEPDVVIEALLKVDPASEPARIDQPNED